MTSETQQGTTVVLDGVTNIILGHEDLKQQAAWLMSEVGVYEEAEGLLNLLDALRDHLADHHDIPTMDLFNIDPSA